MILPSILSVVYAVICVLCLVASRMCEQICREWGLALPNLTEFIMGDPWLYAALPVAAAAHWFRVSRRPDRRTYLIVSAILLGAITIGVTAVALCLPFVTNSGPLGR